MGNGSAKTTTIMRNNLKKDIKKDPNLNQKLGGKQNTKTKKRPWCAKSVLRFTVSREALFPHVFKQQKQEKFCKKKFKNAAIFLSMGQKTDRFMG